MDVACGHGPVSLTFTCSPTRLRLTCDTRSVSSETLNRRQLLRKLAGVGLVGLGALGAGLSVGGCSKRVEPGTTEALPGLHDDGDPLWAPEAEAYLIAFPALAQADADRNYPMRLRGRDSSGVVALKAACPNDGVRVSWCRGDRFFRCAGCSSVFTRYGDCVDGPSPRGLARLELSVNKAREVVIDRSVVIDGPLRGTAIAPAIDPATPCRSLLPAS